MQERRILRLKISRARSNLMFFVILSAFQLYIIATGGSLKLPFASAAALFVSNEFLFLSVQNSDPAIMIWGIALAALVIFVFLLCYLFSKKSSKWMLAGLMLVGIDTLVLLFVAFLNGISGWILDIVLHGMLFYFLMVGVKSHIDYERLPQYDSVDEPIFNINQPNFGNEPQQENSIFSEEHIPEYVDEEELSEPIGEYVDDGTAPLCSGKKNGLQVFAVVKNGIAELVINGQVCDRLLVESKTEYKLCAIVNDIDFSFEYTKTPLKDAMFLYADEELLDSAMIER